MTLLGVVLCLGDSFASGQKGRGERFVEDIVALVLIVETKPLSRVKC